MRPFVAVLSGALLAIAVPLSSRGQTGVTGGSKVGDGTLVPAPGSPYSTGVESRQIASGDFNGDGLADLVVAAYQANNQETSTLTILLATPSGGFVPAPGSPISVGWYNYGLVVADFNGDGNLDIASIGNSLGPAGVQIFLGDGQGGFSPLSPIMLSMFGPGSIATGDFNHDGKTDLAIVGSYTVGSTNTGHVAILLGDGTGSFTFAPGSPMQTAQVPTQVTAADFNGDGVFDLAITSTTSNSVFVLLNDGTGSFYPDSQGPFSTDQFPSAIVHGDFNGDGNEDLAIGNTFSYTLTILLGDGMGGFTPAPAVSVGPGAFVPGGLAVADIDGDGFLDLAVAVDDEANPMLLLFFGDGTGGFQIPGHGFFACPLTPVGVVVADFNGDGRLDVATANRDTGTASVFLGAPVSSSIAFNGPSSNATVGSLFTVLMDSGAQLGFDRPTGMVSLLDGSQVVATADWDSYGNVTFGFTFSTAGVHTLAAQYSGDLRTLASSSPPFTITVAKGSQTISFPALPNQAYGVPPFTVPVFSSSGLPVTLTVVSGPATITGNVLTLTGTGTVTLQASQPGNANYLPAPSVQQQFQVTAPASSIDAVVNAASYAAGSLAPSSYAVVFGVDLASLASSGNLPTTLGGARIQITDASGKLANALLYFASPAQINFLLPSGLSTGTGTMTVQTQAGLSATVAISIAAISPGLFSADATGTGVAAGSALLVSANGTQTQLPINSCSGTPVVCTAVPIDLGSATDTVYLSLYGTGIRGRSALSAVTATMGGVASEVLYAGAQPDFPGLDQVNLQINPALRGRGSVQLALTVDGVPANVVTVAIQ